ncbi:hypothetical protein C8R45DRAFT_251478 [Mycena sanguinolenta]|nr:hypothetical protein C8R45DRAFT_251478 [Mycena sanguinolenta]
MLARFRQSARKAITVEKRMPWNLQDIFPTSAIAAHDLDVYIWLVRETSERPWSGGAHPSATVVESIKLYRHTAAAGDIFLVCQLRHPACHSRKIFLALERFREGANPGEVVSAESPASGLALDRVIVAPTGSDVQLITQSDLLYRTLTFPTSKPTLFDLLALSESISSRNRTYTVTNGSCILYGAAIYCALQKVFGGRSEDSPGCQSTLQAFLSMVDAHEKKILDAFHIFPTARSEFENISAAARLNAMGTNILRAQLTAGFRRQVDNKLAALREKEKDVQRRASLRTQPDARLDFVFSGEKEAARKRSSLRTSVNFSSKLVANVA